MTRQRDYQAEYQRRIARGLASGPSRSQARGHPRSGEAPVSRRTSTPAYDPRLEAGIKLMRAGTPLIRAAPTIGVSRERLRRYAIQTGVVEKQRGRWAVIRDNRVRVMPIFSAGRTLTVTIASYEQAALAGRYMAAVRTFRDSNDPSYLEPFVGEFVTDVRDTRHVFETRPNTLYRLAIGDDEAFEQIYRIVA
ncbi:MAG: hypothetical protein ACR2OO_01025 [Thermomicrobiales bacterium]